MRRAWRWWKEWRPLFLWPLSIALTVSGVLHGSFGADYAHAAYNVLLGYIIGEDADRAARETLATEAE